MSKKKKKPGKPRNQILQIIMETDPERLRRRTVRPEKGYGRKDRPRNNGSYIDSFDHAA